MIYNDHIALSEWFKSRSEISSKTLKSLVNSSSYLNQTFSDVRYAYALPEQENALAFVIR